MRMPFRAIFEQLLAILTFYAHERKADNSHQRKAGSSSVKIYRDRKRSGDYFRLVLSQWKTASFETFNSLDVARKEAAAQAAHFARGDVDAVQLTGKEVTGALSMRSNRLASPLTRRPPNMRRRQRLWRGTLSSMRSTFTCAIMQMGLLTE
jgi:hypothetical protein